MTNKKFFATGLATILILSAFLFVPTKPAYAATYTIDSSGGDCNTIGIWDAKRLKCTLKFNVIGSIDVNGDGITLDGAKRTLTGDGSVDSVGVLVDGQTRVTIKNVIVTNFYFGILLIGGSSGNTLTGNTASSNAEVGIVLDDGSDFNTVTSNTANSNGGDGIVLDSGSGNTLTGNTANSNDRFGILLEDDSGNTLTSNTASSNGGGIGMFSSNGDTLTGNTANSNTGDGINVKGNSNTLTSNTANSNGGDGILIDEVNNNVLQRNTANQNILNGFNLDAADNTVLKSNTANSNGAFGYDTTVDTVGLAFSKNKCSGNVSGGSDPTGLCTPQQ